MRLLVPDVPAGPGINLAVAAECAVELLLEGFGPSPLVKVLCDQQLGRRAAAAVFAHQYFVTIRYVEAVVALLRWRLRPGLRSVAFAYLLEEYGHEAHERGACLAVGLSDEALDRFAPLPFFEAYSDVLGQVAEYDPLAFCLCVIAAEGMPGQRKPLADLLAKQGMNDPAIAVHTDLDDALDHSRFPRRLLREVPWVGGQEGTAALRKFLFALEVSQLAWLQLANWALDSSPAVLPEPFELSPTQVVHLMRP